MKKLTPRMSELLAVLQAGKETAHYMPYRGRFNPHAYYFCMGMMLRSRCTREAQGLLERGLVKKNITNQYSGEHTLILTDSGRAYDLSATSREP